MAITVGAWVRCERARPARGTWRQYAGRTGRVVTVNRAAGELGVRFTASGTESTTWFLVDELVALDGPPVDAPRILTDAERWAAWRDEHLPGIAGRGATGRQTAPGAP